MKDLTTQFEAVGNNGGDVLEIKLLPGEEANDLVKLKVGHCCVFVIDVVVPVEFITAILAKVVLDAGGLEPAMRLVKWEEEHIQKLVNKIDQSCKQEDVF